MRSFFYALLLIALPAFLSAQKKWVTSPKAGQPIIVNTVNGKKNVGVWPDRVPEKPTADLWRQVKKERPRQEQIKSETGKRPASNGLRKMGNCSVKGVVTWTGQNSDDWFDPENWAEGYVPGECDIAVIAGGNGETSAIVNQGATIGGLIMSQADLYVNAMLTIFDTVRIGSSFIDIDGNGSGLEIIDAVDPYINSSSFTGYYPGVSITNFTGGATIFNNTFETYLAITESATRNNGNTYIFGNLYEDLEISVNSTYGNFYLANGVDDEDIVMGQLTINMNSQPLPPVYVGLGGGGAIDEPLQVAGTVQFLYSDPIDPAIYIDKLTLFGENAYQEIITGETIIMMRQQNGRMMGPIEIPPFSVNQLFIRKTYDGRVLLRQDLMVKQKLFLAGPDGNGTRGALWAFGNQYNPYQHLVLDNGAVVVDEDPVGGNYVRGPVSKIGNSALVFPLGDNGHKAPLGISAPTYSNERYRAAFNYRDPGIEGFDPNQKEAGVGEILTNGYWTLEKLIGSSDVNVSLTFDKNNYNDMAIPPSQLQIVGWDGSKWVNHPVGNVTGDADRSTLTTASPVNHYEAFALAMGNLRKPILTLQALPSPYLCRQTPFWLYSSMDTLALPGTTFRVELSDENGDFSNPIILGTVTGNKLDSIQVYIATNQATVGKTYKIRVTASPQSIISENTLEVTIIDAPQGTPVINGNAEVCLNTGAVAYYITNKEAGVTYTWSVNGGTFTTDADTAFVTFTSDGNKTVTVTPSNDCGSGTAVNFAVLVKPGAPTATPALTNTGRWINASAPAPAQKVTAYKWYKNGTLISGATGLSYYANEAGDYTMLYANDCGEGPASNTISFANDAVAQTITFGAIPDKAFGDAPFELNATASSGLPVQYQIVSGQGNITAGVFTITHVGTVTIKATQPGDNEYDTAAPVTQTFIINKGSQSITFEPMEDVIYTGTNKYITLTGSASSGLPVTYSTDATNATIYGKNLTIKGVGTVTITATQPGNANYNAATPVEQTFCVRTDKLGGITGPASLCPGIETVYKTKKIAGLTYNWRLSNGTTFSSDADTVAITWPAQGTYKLYVSAVGPCGPETSVDSLTIDVLDGVTAPDPVQNMLPLNGITDQKLPLFLSWVPGNNTMSYDLYVWETGTSRPAVPMTANRTLINYTLTTQSGLKYDVDYNWQLVSKNGCLQTEGPIQTFRLRKAPDLVVTQVNVPASANSGQTITINWTVKNEGTGNTITNESWNDAVFLSFDTVPQFQIATTSFQSFNALAFPVRPLLIGTKPNVSALNAGQEYQNSMDFTLPLSYSEDLYVYVITNYKGWSNAPPDANHANDTARSADPIDVTMSPTPDLRVDTVQAPATVFSGSTANISYKVTNYGALASGSWNDKIYVSKSPLFDKNNAVLLKYPKANGSYYPYTGVENNGNAFVKINENIETDDFYTRNVEVIIPNFISGTWFVHVVANEDKGLYEGALAENNVNNKAIEIMLTPTPQFSLGAINTSTTVATPAQVVGINWSTTNVGFYDNWEKNKAVYREVTGSCGPEGPIPSAGGSSSAPAPLFSVRHYVSYGASYWEDKVYLSTDPSGLNTSNATYLGVAKHGVEGVGSLPENDPPILLNDTTYCTSFSTNYPYSQHVLKPGSVHPTNFEWTVPTGLPEGDYYIYVVSNADKQIFTYIDTPVIRRSNMITVSYPDVTVPVVSVPASVRGGTPFSIDYTITNTSAVSITELERTDQIYISNNAVFDGTATKVKSFSFTESIPAGESVTHTVSLTLPNSTAGTKYIFVKTNSNNSFAEANTNNNISNGNATSVSTALPMDLMADMFSIGENIQAPGSLSVQYTVRNVGENNVSDTMVDKIYISCNPVFSEATAIEIWNWKGYRSLVAGDETNVTVNVTIPKQAYLINNCFAKADVSNAYFFVKTNATETVYEPDNMANNVAGSGEKTIENQNADIVISKVTGDESAKVARPFNVQWEIVNNGKASTLTPYLGRRTDAIYISKDSTLNENAILLKKMVYGENINLDVTISKSLNVTMPLIEEGDYYVYVFTDLDGTYLNEIDRSNNFNFLRDASGKAKLIHVEGTLLPDLTGEIISAPQRVAVGQPFTVKYKVTNTGVGATYPERWWDYVFLSVNTSSSGRVSGVSKSHNGILNFNETYTDSVTMTLPLSFLPGNYLLLTHPNGSAQVTESDENNNINGISIEVYIPEQVDLTVENVTAPDTVYLGYPTEEIQWVVKNQSPSEARGASVDGVYLSKNATYDSTALLIGTKSKYIKMPPAARETLSMTSVIDNVPEGLYNIIVRTDIKNNIYESDKDNNENVTSKPVYVSVKQLTLDVSLTDTMTTPKYYKLLIPDSLKGSTILITLKSKDSLTQQNEVYVGGGYVPSVLKSDYKFNTPNYGNQEVLLADVTESVYYIAVRSVTVTPKQQDITLHASVLPFAVLNVQSDKGGNGGNVTVKLTGSLFSNGMTALLTGGGNTIEATKVYFINSTEVYATFPLLGKAIGVYDVKLVKPDYSEAVLPGAFSVVSPDNGGLYSGGGVNTGMTGNGTDPGCDPGTPAGLNSQLSVELVAPQRAFVGLPFPIVINYSNPTNMDIPVQTMVLYNDYGLPMSFTRDGIQNGTTSLYLKLTGKDGPPGVFRAGSGGTIVIYTTTPPGTPPHEFIHFNLK